jgi:hypothetical protein
MGLAKSFKKKKKRERIEEARKKREEEKASYPKDTTYEDILDTSDETRTDINWDDHTAEGAKRRQVKLFARHLLEAANRPIEPVEKVVMCPRQNMKTNYFINIDKELNGDE